MNELTDIEICKKIAEIEGVGYLVSNNNRLYNPLTDKALCFDLMIKHNVEVSPTYLGSYIASCYCKKEQRMVSRVNQENPQRAICLAIIAKHK